MSPVDGSVTRRRLLALGAAGAAGALLAACGGGDDDDDADGSGSTTAGTAASTVTSTPPDVAEPTDASGSSGAIDTEVVVLDEIAALSVLSLGVVPKSVDATFGYSSVADICEQLGVVVNPGERNIEAVAADQPSAIVGVSIPTYVDALDRYEEIAPSSVVDFALGWAEQLDAVGGALGREDEAEARKVQLTEAVEQLRADIEAAGKTGTTVSVMAGSDDGPFALSRTGLVGEVLADVGLARPAAQDVATDPTAPFVDISPERLTDHDADVLLLMVGPAYRREPVEASPLWGQLGAVANDQVYEVFAEIWFAASAFSLDWVLRDVRAAVLGEGSPATGEQVIERWESFAAQG